MRVPVVLKLTTWEMPATLTSLSDPAKVPRKDTAWPTMGAAARQGATCCMAEPAESRVFPSRDSSCGDIGRRHLVCVRIGLHTFHLRGITESRVREFEGRGGLLGDATVTITPVDLRGRGVPHYELRAPITCIAHAAERCRQGLPTLPPGPTEGLPEKGAGVKETFGPARNGLWRPGPEHGEVFKPNCEALSVYHRDRRRTACRRLRTTPPNRLIGELSNTRCQGFRSRVRWMCGLSNGS